MPTSEAIRDRLLEMLVQSIEVKAEKYGEEAWRTGIPGAILEGRINLIQELLDWIEGKETL
jgi:hypothetical protein